MSDSRAANPPPGWYDDGSGRRQIPVQDGKLLTPILNPDGTRLAYLRIVKSVIEKVSPPKLPTD